MHNPVENAQLAARSIICTRSYVQRAQLGRECTIFNCVTTTRLCHLQGILPKLALLAYIDTLVVQAKLTHNKSVVHLKNTRDRRPLAVSNQKGWNAALSLNFNAKLMQQENFAPDYNVFTGKPTTPITHFGEVHTGELFEPAQAKYCGDNPTNMPCPLILFYDKTFVDLHGSLACSPVIMWPTFSIKNVETN